MTEHVDVWVLRTDEAGGAVLDLTALSAAERARVDGYRRPEDAALSAGGALLVRAIAGRALGVAPAEVRVDRVCAQCGGPHGIPRVVGAPHLSVSHCLGTVVVAACVGHQVGIDVEDAARGDAGGVVGQLLAPSERAAGLSPSDLLRYWVRKEAVVKATGRGLYADLRSVLVSPPDAAPAVLAYGPDPEQPFALADIELDGVLCAVAVLTDTDLAVTVRDGAELLHGEVHGVSRNHRYGRRMADRADGDDRAVPKIKPKADEASREASRSVLDRVRSDIWRLIVATVASCMRYRVTGLAAEAAFFAILSIPPLVFAFAGAIGFVTDRFTAAQVDDVRSAVIDLSERALTDRAVAEVVVPTIDSVLSGGRLEVISIGFVLALWSGSRALNVFVDTITIMHGLGGHRGIVKTRALSFLLYVLGLITGMVSIPLIVAGPSLVDYWLPERVDFLNKLYWPTVVVLCICFLATLYHVSVPVRTSWSFNLPGATFSFMCWVLGSYLLREVLTATAADSKSIYGPLAAPIAVLIWLYVLSIAVLIGAAVNAAFDTVFPQSTTTSARLELVQRLRSAINMKD